MASRVAFLIPALLALASGVRADVPQECRDLYVESRFDAADECFTRALRRAAGAPDRVAEIYAFRAAILAARRRDDEARQAMEVVLALQPDWSPADPLLTSPKVTDLLGQVRSSVDLAEGPPSLEFTPADAAVQESSVRIEARIANLRPPLEPFVLVRRDDEADWSRARLVPEPGTDVYVASLPIEPGERLTYFLAVLAPGGAVALRSGTRERPWIATGPQASGGAGAGGSGGVAVGDGNGQQGLARRYWWLWTIIGVAVAGATVGIAVAATAEPSTPTGSLELHFP